MQFLLNNVDKSKLIQDFIIKGTLSKSAIAFQVWLGNKRQYANRNSQIRTWHGSYLCDYKLLNIGHDMF